MSAWGRAVAGRIGANRTAIGRRAVASETGRQSGAATVSRTPARIADGNGGMSVLIPARMSCSIPSMVTGAGAARQRQAQAMVGKPGGGRPGLAATDPQAAFNSRTTRKPGGGGGGKRPGADGPSKPPERG